MRPVFILLALAAAGSNAGLATVLQDPEPQRPVVRFGLVIDGPWDGNDRVRELFETELRNLLQSDFQPEFPPDKRITADWTLESVSEAVEQLLTDPDVDIFLAMGPVSSQVTAARTGFEKPAVAAFVLDAALQGLPSEGGGSGVPNLSYVSLPLGFREDFEIFRGIARFEHLVFLANPHFLAASHGLAANAERTARELGISITVLPAEPPAGTVLRALPDDAEAVYLAPLLHFPQSEWEALIEALNDRGLPTFATMGVTEVQRGVFAGRNTPDFFPRVARRVALNVQRILLGEDAASLPVAFSPGQRLTINMETARRVGVLPTWAVLVEADLVNQEPRNIARTLSLDDAVQAAVDANLDLRVQARAVAAGEQNIAEARSILLPQLELSSTTTVIDEDRASASLGAQPQRSLRGGLTLSQLVFAEPALANVAIQRHLQTALVVDQERIRLDIALEAATAYLNVLRAKAIERIQRNNLAVTRTNLELARVRNAVGTSGPGEVFRWEAELAHRRIDVIDAQANRALVEVALNRLLNLPQEDLFETVEASLDDPVLVTSDPRLNQYIDNPLTYRAFRDFMVLEGLGTAPEIRQVDAAIAAQRRVLRSANNAFWSPTIALQTDLSGRLASGGAGSAFSLNLPPGSPDLSTAFPQADDLDWSVGVRLSLPLLEGGSRFAQRAQASEELAQLEAQHDAVAERVEQRIRSALHSMRSSYPSIQLSSDAAVAARRNLELVTDAYGRGVVSILELLDAQNASLASDEAAANAVYEFLLDLMELQRATGHFDFFVTPEQRESFFERLEWYYEGVGVPRGNR